MFHLFVKVNFYKLALSAARKDFDNALWSGAKKFLDLLVLVTEHLMLETDAKIEDH